MNLVEFTENLIKNIVREPDMVKVQEFPGDEDITMLEVIVQESDMGAVIGRGGKTATAIRTIVQAYGYLNNIKKIKINIDSF